MNFYEHQDNARRASRRLIWMFAAALLAVVFAVDWVVAHLIAANSSAELAPFTFLLIPDVAWWGAHWGAMLFSSLGVLGFIGCANVYKTASLRGGGYGLAQQVGGVAITSDSKDPLHRRLLNVTEEMAIASGVPVPQLFVMEAEPAINAFVAGYNASDAVMVVSRGSLEQLDRNELQGVVAHEFSHIMNGDMRLNIRLVGWLFGLIAIGMIGRIIMRSLRRGNGYFGRYGHLGGRRDSKGDAGLFIFGLTIYAIGYVGVFFGRLMRAAISRQREYLADASAVQLTRQTSGIAGALKKIAGLIEGSQLSHGRAEEVGHMLFASGQSYFSGLATHPPLGKRIHALDPSFNAESIKRWQSHPLVKSVVNELKQNGRLPEDYGYKALYETTDHRLPVSDQLLTQHIGQPGPDHILYAQGLRTSIPKVLYEAAHSTSHSLALLMTLLLHQDESVRQKQFMLLQQRLGPTVRQSCEQFYEALRSQSLAYRLPLLAVVFPTLKLRPAGHLAFIESTALDLVSIDGEIDALEWVLLALLRVQFYDAMHPAHRQRGARLNQKAIANALSQLLGFCARAAHNDMAEAKQAATAGFSSVYGESQGHQVAEAFADGQAPVPNDLLDCMLQLDRLPAKQKQRVVNALVETVQFDGKVTPLEAELLRGTLACLHIPTAPILQSA